MTEALRAVIKYSFESMDLGKNQAIINMENELSQKLA
jgi:RimJ/RimL family protein N-acetyltransferase